MTCRIIKCYTAFNISSRNHLLPDCETTLFKTLRDILRLNVGFILKESVGYSRKLDFEYPLLEVADDLDLANFRGALRLTRTAQGIYAQGKFSGDESVECVRCLTQFTQTLQSKVEQLYEFPPNPKAEFVVSETGHLDLAPFLREDMILSRPMRPLCKPDCKGICPQCGKDLNEGPCDCVKEDINPQMAVLKKLLGK